MDKKLYQNYTVADFAADESFISYYFHLNENDVIFWNKWIAENPSKRLLIKEAKEMVNSLSVSLGEKEYRSELDKIKFAINKKPQSVICYAIDSKRPKSIKRSLLIAASLVVIIIASAWFIINGSGKAAPVNRTIASNDTPLQLTLSDSTIVTLAPHSSLQFPSSFTGKNRQVYLQGDANFQVKHDEKFPFKVHAKNIVTTVLGTVFNIKHSGDSAIVVELLKGRVNVSVDDSGKGPLQPILLYPDEKAIYVFHDNLFYKYASETRFNIMFQKSTFPEIANRIRQVYGLTVINNSSKKVWRFTGQFTNQNAEEVIENICLVKGLHSKRLGDTIIINN